MSDILTTPFSWIAQAKAFDEDGLLPAMANTPNVDRYREIVLPSAFQKTIGIFKTNPVLLAMHMHSPMFGSAEPTVIGIVPAIDVTNEGLPFKAAFAPEDIYPRDTKPLGPLFRNLYAAQILRAFSIGFMVNSFTSVDSEEELAELITELPEDLVKQILRAFRGKDPSGRARVVITLAELLEISAVAVPANRESLVLAAEDGMDEARVILRSLPEDTDPDVASPEFGAADRGLGDREHILGQQAEGIREWVAKVVGVGVTDVRPEDPAAEPVVLGEEAQNGQKALALLAGMHKDAFAELAQDAPELLRKTIEHVAAAAPAGTFTIQPGGEIKIGEVTLRCESGVAGTGHGEVLPGNAEVAPGAEPRTLRVEIVGDAASLDARVDRLDKATAAAIAVCDRLEKILTAIGTTGEENEDKNEEGDGSGAAPDEQPRHAVGGEAGEASWEDDAIVSAMDEAAEAAEAMLSGSGPKE